MLRYHLSVHMAAIRTAFVAEMFHVNRKKDEKGIAAGETKKRNGIGAGGDTLTTYRHCINTCGS